MKTKTLYKSIRVSEFSFCNPWNVSDKIKKNECVDERFFEIEDKECALTAIEFKMEFMKFIELAQYEVEYQSRYPKRAMSMSDYVVGQLVVAPKFMRARY